MPEPTENAILALMERHGICEFEYQDDVTRLTLSRGTTRQRQPAAPLPGTARPPLEVVTAAHAGIFRATHPLSVTTQPLPRNVEEGEILGYLQAGPVLRPVTAPSRGMLVRLLAAEGEAVGYGTPLFQVRKG